MKSRLLEPDVLFVFLPPEPQLRPELVLLRENVARVEDKHLVLDLSRVEIITSPSIGSLLLLQRSLAQRGYGLVLCNTRLATRCVLRVAGLDTFFAFANGKYEALSVLRRSPGSAVGLRAPAD